MSNLISDYDILRYPLVTEKSASVPGVHVFVVRKEASKSDVSKAVEAIYSVKVRSVNTLIMKGKAKRFKGRLGKRSDFKKAYVRLQDGFEIDLGIGNAWDEGRVGYGG